jgi:hypothetical protein
MNKTNITILEIVDKGTQVKVKGQGNDGQHTYSVFKTKQDGSFTQAYTMLKEKTINDKICFGWEEYHGEYQGKSYVSRSVKMAEVAGKPDYVPNIAQEVKTAPRPAQSLTKETDWDKIAEGKVRNSVAVAFIGQGKKFEPLVVTEMNKWVGWIMTGQMFNKEPMNVPVNEEQDYPPMPEDDQIDVRSIPF